MVKRPLFNRTLGDSLTVQSRLVNRDTSVNKLFCPDYPIIPINRSCILLLWEFIIEINIKSLEKHLANFLQNLTFNQKEVFSLEKSEKIPIIRSFLPFLAFMSRLSNQIYVFQPEYTYFFMSNQFISNQPSNVNLLSNFEGSTVLH